MEAVVPDDLSQVVGLDLPAPGAGLTYNVAGSEYVHPRCLAFTLTTNGNAATRIVTLSVVSGGGATLATIPAPVTQIASLTYTYTFGLGLTAQTLATATAQVAQLPDLWLRGGDKITVAVAAMDAADKITNAWVVVDQIGWLAARDA